MEGGVLVWSSPTNAGVSDDTYANASGGALGTETTNELKFTDFMFSIGSNQTILGIQATNERNRGGAGGSSSVVDNLIQLLKGGTLTGDNKADTGTNWPTTDGTAAYGDGTDLWGITWIASEINASDFGIVLQADITGDSELEEQAQVDLITLEVFHQFADDVIVAVLQNDNSADFVVNRSRIPADIVGYPRTRINPVFCQTRTSKVLRPAPLSL